MEACLSLSVGHREVACPGQTRESAMVGGSGGGVFLCACLSVFLAQWDGMVQNVEGLRYQINIWTGDFF